MLFPWWQWLAGALLAGLVAGAVWRLGWLTFDGALAAWVVGGVTFGGGGWWWAALLLTFFGSSSLLSQVGKRRKQPLQAQFAKGAARDALQVLANGGVTALAALGDAVAPASAWWWLAAGALAAANADTWATELGVLSPHPPRDLRTGRPAPAGTSGAVSPLGLVAAALGAGLLGGLAAWGAGTGWNGWLAVTLGGWLGAWVDSLLGATVQARYFCPRCERLTEHHPHHACGAPTELRGGWRWLDNDAVNLAATLSGAMLTWGLYRLFG